MNTSSSPATPLLQRYLLWAAVGAILVIDAFLLQAFCDDGGFLASSCALLATILMTLPLLAAIAADLRAGRLHMHELSLVAILAACAIPPAALPRPDASWLEALAASAFSSGLNTAAAIAFFTLLSLAVERRTASGAQASLEKLARLSPGLARRLRPDGSEEEVAPASLQPGDLIRVRPGDAILADGTVRAGRSSVNEANISGESLPVDKDLGAQVFAGTTNMNGLLEITVSRTGADTTIGRVRELILRAESTRLPFVRLIDSCMRFYSPAVLTIAALILFFNRDELPRVVAALVIACPVGLILSSPTAIVAALSAAARAGLLVKDVNHLEAIGSADAAVFDKTGTLTTGRLHLAALIPLQPDQGPLLLKAAAIAEAQSSHPVARAVCLFASRARLSLESPAELHEEPGRGVRARAASGSLILAGNAAWMADNAIDPQLFVAALAAPQAQSMSLLYIAVDGLPLGLIGLSDTPRTDAAEMVAELTELGFAHLAIVSGDRPAVASAVASDIGITHAQGGCSPEDKVTAIRKLRSEGRRVIFIGDGVNDGPALATADIGIAMGAAGSDVAVESASVALMNAKLDRLAFLVRLGRSLSAIVLQNILAGMALIAAGLGLAAAGLLPPILAAALQLLGSLAVIMNSARLVRHGEDLSAATEDAAP